MSAQMAHHDPSHPLIVEVHAQRTGLRRAMVALEIAAAAPLTGRPEEWVAALAPHMQALLAAWSRHIEVTEGPNGLFEQIRTDAPGLDFLLLRLHRDHARMLEDMGALARDAAASTGEGALQEVRDRITDLQSRVTRHRQLGADVLYKAYAVDIGAGD